MDEVLEASQMDQVLEASHAIAAAKKDRDLVARLSRADETLQMHSRGMKVANDTAAQAEEMVTRFQCAVSDLGSMLALAKDREQHEATAAAAARSDLIALQRRLAVETASHAGERKGLEAKWVMTKDVRHNLCVFVDSQAGHDKGRATQPRSEACCQRRRKRCRKKGDSGALNKKSFQKNAVARKAIAELCF